MKVLIIGSGGREHALAWKAKASPRVTELYCAPGNAGIGEIATNVPIPVVEIEALVQWAADHQIDLTIVGPEEPLARGIVDVFESRKLRIFGPTQAAARLESSKSFAKEVMLKSGVSTPRGEVFDDLARAREYVQSHGAPIVVKADGLAAGKGVVVARSEAEAIAALESFMLHDKFGTAGRKVVIEECIVGREASVIALIDGETILPLVVSQDYKRLSDGDLGPNTGGMGAISPSFVLHERELPKLVETIFQPVIRELQRRGVRYRGFLYAGVIVDEADEVRVLEFNCRLGDPETEVLLPRLESDLIDVLDRAVQHDLSAVRLRWRPECAVCVVMASRGYPERVDDQKEIVGMFPPEQDLVAFHCGTVRVGQGVVTKGGRIVTVSALGATVEEARARAYQGVQRIRFEGEQHRSDIGARPQLPSDR